MNFVNIRVPDSIVCDENTHIWLEDIIGADGGWCWQDTPSGHFLHLSEEDMLIFKLKFGL